MARRVVKNPQLCEYRHVHTVGFRQYSHGRPRGKAGRVRILTEEQKALVIQQLAAEGRLQL